MFRQALERMMRIARVARHKELKDNQQMQMGKAIEEELEGIFGLGAPQEVKGESTLPNDANIANSRFALAIKDEGQTNERCKARLVAQGRKDALKDYIARDSPTVMKCSVRTMLSLAKLCDFNIHSRDAKQAYLQSECKLGRDLRIRLPRMQHGKGGVWKIAKPIHGIIESDDLWLDARLFAFHE